MEKYTSYFPEEREAVIQIMKILNEKIIPELHRLDEIELPSEEEEKLKIELTLCLEKAIPAIEAFSAGLGQHLFKFSQDLMLDAKLKGEKGDEQRMHFYRKLKDSFHAALRERLENN